MIGPGIIVPLVIVAIVVPVVYVVVRDRLRTAGGSTDDVHRAGAVLTSAALRRLPSPPWRLIHEVPTGRLGGIEHVIVGPAGVFAVTAVFSPLPPPRDDPPSAVETADAAIIRGRLDDLLGPIRGRCDAHVVIHWGRTDAVEPAVELVHGVVAVDGRRLEEWAATLPGDRLAPAQVDLAWQTICLAIGRPDPLGR